MPQISCPSCKRKGTYSEKFEQCSACGLGYEVTPVTPKVVSEPKVVTETGSTPKVVVGEPCPTCGKKVGRRVKK